MQKKKTLNIFSAYKLPQIYADSVCHNAERRYKIVIHLAYGL